ncbi:Uncharacterized protein HZ326_4173 [Fusarium oxysporum f. sp. albedinis]|nr:Uncharacterized protein HZ326_4173 [Fusarium oxysporum f. sp. albedinis]
MEPAEMLSDMSLLSRYCSLETNRRQFSFILLMKSVAVLRFDVTVDTWAKPKVLLYHFQVSYWRTDLLWN